MSKVKPPRHPVVVIGAGIAGLAAAWYLKEAGIPHLVLEKFEGPGGRLNSRQGEGWLADHGVPYFFKDDTHLSNLVRGTGMETNRVSVQGGIHVLQPDGTIVRPRDGGVDPNRMCLDTGFRSLAAHVAHYLDVRYHTAVGGIRWDNDAKVFWWDKEGQVFWFVDESGEPIRYPATKDVLVASGVILATTGTAALRIALNSRSLEGIVPALEKVTYSSTFTGIFKVPRLSRDFYAVRGTRGARLSWLAFEERKAPERVDPRFSLLVADASPAYSGELFAMQEEVAMVALYEEVKRVLPELPAAPLTQTYKRWPSAQLSSAPIGAPEAGHWATNPEHAPFALAGDYILGGGVEDAAKSGDLAARTVMALLPKKRSFLGLEVPA